MQERAPGSEPKVLTTKYKICEIFGRGPADKEGFLRGAR
jgi:hypothetical protein